MIPLYQRDAALKFAFNYLATKPSSPGQPQEFYLTPDEQCELFCNLNHAPATVLNAINDGGKNNMDFAMFKGFISAWNRDPSNVSNTSPESAGACADFLTNLLCKAGIDPQMATLGCVRLSNSLRKNERKYMSIIDNFIKTFKPPKTLPFESICISVRAGQVKTPIPSLAYGLEFLCATGSVFRGSDFEAAAAQRWSQLRGFERVIESAISNWESKLAAKGISC